MAAARARSCLLGDNRYAGGVPFASAFFSNSLTRSLTVDLDDEEGWEGVSEAGTAAEADAYIMLSAETACLSARMAGRGANADRVWRGSSSGRLECDADRDGAGILLVELDSSPSLACGPGRLGFDRTGWRDDSDLTKLDDDEVWLSRLWDVERVRPAPLPSAPSPEATRLRCSFARVREADRVRGAPRVCDDGADACVRDDDSASPWVACSRGRSPGRGLGLDGPPSAGMSR